MTCQPHAVGRQQFSFSGSVKVNALCPRFALVALTIIIIIKNRPGEHTRSQFSPNFHGGPCHFTEEMGAHGA